MMTSVQAAALAAAATARAVAKDVNDAKTNGLHRQRVKPDLKPFIVQCIVTKTIPALWHCKSTK